MTKSFLRAGSTLQLIAGQKSSPSWEVARSISCHPHPRWVLCSAPNPKQFSYATGPHFSSLQVHTPQWFTSFLQHPLNNNVNRWGRLFTRAHLGWLVGGYLTENPLIDIFREVVRGSTWEEEEVINLRSIQVATPSRRGSNLNRSQYTD